jgi:tetratricopeptide (TPR) repeat protein
MGVYQESYGPDHHYLSGIYKGYARASSKLGYYAAATNYFNKALDIYKKNEFTGDAEYAKFFEAFGNHFKRSGDYEKAKSNFKKCAELFAPLIYDEYKIRSAKCQMNLVELHIILNEKDKAEIVRNDLQQRIDTTKVLANIEEISELFNEIVY